MENCSTTACQPNRERLWFVEKIRKVVTTAFVIVATRSGARKIRGAFLCTFLEIKLENGTESKVWFLIVYCPILNCYFFGDFT